MASFESWARCHFATFISPASSATNRRPQDVEDARQFARPARPHRQYGADAIRFARMRSAPLGQDVLSTKRTSSLAQILQQTLDACRSAKCRAVMSRRNQFATAQQRRQMDFVKWIKAIREITDALGTYNFSISTSNALPLFLDGIAMVCQASKQSSRERMQRKKRTLLLIDFILLHTCGFSSLSPFITEELWHGWVMPRHAENQGGKDHHASPVRRSRPRISATTTASTIATSTSPRRNTNSSRWAANLAPRSRTFPRTKSQFILKSATNCTPHDCGSLKLLAQR